MDFFQNKNVNLNNLQRIADKTFICGYCNDKIASDRGYKLGINGDGSGIQVGGIFICPNCHGPNFVSMDGVWYPGHSFGTPSKIHLKN